MRHFAFRTLVQIRLRCLLLSALDTGSVPGERFLVGEVYIEGFSSCQQRLDSAGAGHFADCVDLQSLRQHYGELCDTDEKAPTDTVMWGPWLGCSGLSAGIEPL